jgi:hypothetical protein
MPNQQTVCKNEHAQRENPAIDETWIMIGGLELTTLVFHRRFCSRRLSGERVELFGTLLRLICLSVSLSEV